MGQDSVFNPLGSAIEGTELSISGQTSGDFLTYNGTAWVRTSPALSLKASSEVTGSDTNAIDFASLDIDTDECYEFLLIGKNANASANNISMGFNDDTTTTNYRYQYKYANGSSVSAANNNAIMAASIGAGKDYKVHGIIYRDITGLIRCDMFWEYEDGTNLKVMRMAGQTTGSSTNLTKINFASSLVDGFAVGTKAAIYKRAMS